MNCQIKKAKDNWKQMIKYDHVCRDFCYVTRNFREGDIRPDYRFAYMSSVRTLGHSRGQRFPTYLLYFKCGQNEDLTQLGC